MMWPEDSVSSLQSCLLSFCAGLRDSLTLKTWILPRNVSPPRLPRCLPPGSLGFVAPAAPSLLLAQNLNGESLGSPRPKQWLLCSPLAWLPAERDTH